MTNKKYLKEFDDNLNTNHLIAQPHLERFTPNTELNPHLHFYKLPTPTYTMVSKKSSTPHQGGGGRNYACYIFIRFLKTEIVSSSL